LKEVTGDAGKEEGLRGRVSEVFEMSLAVIFNCDSSKCEAVL